MNVIDKYVYFNNTFIVFTVVVNVYAKHKTQKIWWAFLGNSCGEKAKVLLSIENIPINYVCVKPRKVSNSNVKCTVVSRLNL